MRRANLVCGLCTVLTVLIASPFAVAQWPHGDGMPIGDRAGQQSVPKIHATSDGGCYISWFDNSGSGYDVCLQRLDAVGNEMWEHNGIVVAARSYTWTMDYGLDVDDADNALLAFRDDRGGGDKTTVAKIAPDGTHVWGPDGVQVASMAEFIASPQVAVASDGNIFVAWTHDDDVRLQRLDADGDVLWGADVIIRDPLGTSLTLSDLHASDGDGGAIVAIKHGFSGATLQAQKISADGDPLWGADPLSIFEAGALQFGYFPKFVSDGAGGAVFGWYYVVGTYFNCAIQRVLADGTELFPHQGVDASTLATQIRVSPAVSFNPATNETFLFWTENNLSQSLRGVYGQRFDESGNRMWTDSGTVLVPLGDGDHWSVCSLAYDDGALACWLSSSGFDQDVVRAARLNLDGEMAWTPEIIDVAWEISGKSRLAADLSPIGVALLAWMDNRDGSDDIYAQNIHGSGAMGICPGDLDGDGDIDLADLAQLLAHYGTTSGAEPGDGDIDRDGDVDLADLAALLSNYGHTC